MNSNNYLTKKHYNKQSINPDIISDLAHELETPLTVVRETLQLILNGSCGPVTDRQYELLDLSEQSLSRLIRLVSAILDNSNVKENTPLKKNHIHIPRFLEKLSKNYEKYFKEKNISMEYKVSLKKPVVHANEDSLTQVLINLLTNALKYNLPGGITQIQVNENKSKILFEVFNTGNWIPENLQDKIFDKYEQIHNADNGSGIGLSIVKDIIERHHGKIWVESAPDKGTTFKFNLPK